MERKPIDRLLPWLLFGLVAGCSLLLVLYSWWLEKRDRDLEGLALMRAHQMVNVRLEAAFHEWDEDLLEEAQAVRETRDTMLLLSRWRTLLTSHWSVLSVRLADERGNELGLYRADTLIHVVLTHEGSKDTVPLFTRLLSDHTDSLWQPWDSESSSYDPRERIWFSKALESDRDAPVWSVRQFGDTSEVVLQVSTLARSAGSDEAYQVMMFDVALDRSSALDTRGAGLFRHGFALVDSEGRQVLMNAAGSQGGLAQVMSQALARWSEDRSDRTFRLGGAEGDYVIQVRPFSLNGLNLYGCLAMDASPLVTWTAPERRFRNAAAAILAILAVLLALLWMRGNQRRREAVRLSLQVKQLAHRLDKATGERDVLGREVHHRVKNNLQVVSSILNLQASSLEDGPVRDEFLRGKRRIDTIALAHHKLYDHPDLRDIDLQVFLSQLTAAIADMHPERKGTVSIGVETGGIKADQDTAIELGIIVCELVTNAYQHAFPHATGGHVAIIITRVDGDLHRLVVRNNGVAPEQALLSGPGKLGLEIVEALAEQLDGSLHVGAGPQTVFEVLFRMQRPAGSAEILGDPETLR